MKKIFKKNQIIITALAIMIIIAGYLNFSQRNASEEADLRESEVVDYDINEETASDNLDDSSLFGFLKPGKDLDDVVIQDEEQGQQISDTGEIVGETQASADASSDELAGTAIAEGESDVETPPGEAVLVSTTTSADYFMNARLEREHLRAKNNETLMGILESASVSEEDKSKATQEIINLTSISEKEQSTETLLEAKGYSDAIVRITEENVTAIVNAASLNEQDVAKIEDIVKRETGADIKEIVIAPVVVNE